MWGQADEGVTAKSCSGDSDEKLERMWSQIRNAPIANKKGEQIRNEKQTKFARGSRQHENNLQQQCPFLTGNCNNNHQICSNINYWILNCDHFSYRATG